MAIASFSGLPPPGSLPPPPPNCPSHLRSFRPFQLAFRVVGRCKWVNGVMPGVFLSDSQRDTIVFGVFVLGEGFAHRSVDTAKRTGLCREGCPAVSLMVPAARQLQKNSESLVSWARRCGGKKLERAERGDELHRRGKKETCSWLLFWGRRKKERSILRVLKSRAGLGSSA